MNKYRFYLGVVLVFLGVALPFIVSPLVLSTSLSSAWKTSIIGVAVVGGPEIFMVFAAIVAGKENVKLIVSKVSALFSHMVGWHVDSKLKYYSGLILIGFGLLVTTIELYAFPEQVLLSNGQISTSYINSLVGDFCVLIGFVIAGQRFFHRMLAILRY